MPWKRLSDVFISVTGALTLTLILASGALAAPKYKVLHAFTGGKDGGGLWGSLLLDKRGNLYGTTLLNTVFELTPGRNGWHVKVLYTFKGKDGAGPHGGLIFDPVGNLYGTTTTGGAHDSGVAFELTPGSSGWAETVLYNFCSLPGCKDGGSPWAGLVRDKAGNLYGTGYAAFELSPGPDGWKEVALHDFTCRNHDGCGPFAGVIMDTVGNLYGATERGGSYKAGTVYELRSTSGGWKERVLHSFPASQYDGQVPGVGALVFDGAGSVYGTTNQGGRHTCVDVGCGTVFKLTPGSNGQWAETILYNFTGNANGSGPGGGLVMDKAGNLYGTTIAGGTGCDCGVVYELAPGSKGKWKYTVLHRFTGFDGAQPDANLILDKKGNLYGTTATGGAGGYGVAFELTP